MKQITFIHAADLHLDSPMIGLSHLPKEIFERLKESTFVALKKLVDEAINHQVDFVILAGDLFDEYFYTSWIAAAKACRVAKSVPRRASQ